ncbi:MAG: glycosyltransferase family 4 protein [Bacteroidia bacterium]|nr:glycosyltransferase family 4 protein [Bacteroidia bacterium]
MAENSNKIISFCSSSYFEYDRRMQRICNTLAENGCDIKWISRSYNQSYKEKQFKFHNIIFKNIFKKGPLFYIEINFRIFLLLLFTRQDVISVVDLDTLLAGKCASILKNKPLVFDAHEIFYEVPELNGKPVRKKIWKLLASLIIPGLNHCYTVNHSLRKHYEDKYNTKFGVVMNVPLSYTNAVSLESRVNTKTLLYIGALNAGRGLELTIKSMVHLADYSLIIVGEGDLSAELRKMAKHSKASERIHFAGFVKPDELYIYLEKASIGLNILISESENYRLSLANKYFDYIHAGIPSVSMNYPEYNRINHQFKTGYLLNELTTEAFCDAIAYIEQPNNYLRAQKECKQAVKVYNWNQESINLLKIYNAINA